MPEQSFKIVVVVLWKKLLPGLHAVKAMAATTTNNLVSECRSLARTVAQAVRILTKQARSYHHRE